VRETGLNVSVVPSLDALAADLGKTAQLPREAAAALYARAAGVEAALRARLLADGPASVPIPKVEADEWIGPEEVTKRFGLDLQWLRRHRAVLRSRRILSTPSRKKSLYHPKRLARYLEERSG
jgi:hypothetical protein